MMMRIGFIAAILTGVLASSAAAQEALRECAGPGSSIAAALEVYEAMPEKIEDDRTPVNDIEFAEALAGAREVSANAVRWRQKPPAYAVSALADAREAACAAAFDVATSGRTMNIAVSCTDVRFEADVRRSVANMLFLPKRENDVAVAARRLVQPYSFCLAD